MIETAYKKVRGKYSGWIYELWTSKYGTPFITESKPNGDVIMTFEFKSFAQRERVINKLVKEEKIIMI